MLSEAVLHSPKLKRLFAYCHFGHQRPFTFRQAPCERAAINCLRSAWLPVLPLQQLGLRCRQACDGHARARAGNIIEPDVMAKMDGTRMPAMFTTNAHFQIRVGYAAF